MNKRDRGEIGECYGFEYEDEVFITEPHKFSKWFRIKNWIRNRILWFRWFSWQ